MLRCGLEAFLERLFVRIGNEYYFFSFGILHRYRNYFRALGDDRVQFLKVQPEFLPFLNSFTDKSFFIFHPERNTLKLSSY